MNLLWNWLPLAHARKITWPCRRPFSSSNQEAICHAHNTCHVKVQVEWSSIASWKKLWLQTSLTQSAWQDFESLILLKSSKPEKFCHIIPSESRKSPLIPTMPGVPNALALMFKLHWSTGGRDRDPTGGEIASTILNHLKPLTKFWSNIVCQNLKERFQLQCQGNDLTSDDASWA